MFSHTWLDRSGPRGTVQGLCICFQKLFISVTSQLCSSLVVHPPKKSPGSAPALHVLAKNLWPGSCMFSYAWHWLHVFPHDSQLTSFPMRGTGYMFPLNWFALLLKKVDHKFKNKRFVWFRWQMSMISVTWLCLSNQKRDHRKKRANCDSQEIHRWKLRGSILDSIITESRDSVSVVQVALWTLFKW